MSDRGPKGRGNVVARFARTVVNENARSENRENFESRRRGPREREVTRFARNVVNESFRSENIENL